MMWPPKWRAKCAAGIGYDPTGPISDRAVLKAPGLGLRDPGPVWNSDVTDDAVPKKLSALDEDRPLEVGRRLGVRILGGHPVEVVDGSETIFLVVRCCSAKKLPANAQEGDVQTVARPRAGLDELHELTRLKPTGHEKRGILHDFLEAPRGERQTEIPGHEEGYCRTPRISAHLQTYGIHCRSMPYVCHRPAMVLNLLDYRLSSFHEDRKE